MKAKDLAAKFNAAPEDKREEVIEDIIFNAIQETRELALKRGVKTDAAMAAIIRECDDKWRAFARLCPAVSPDGFKVVLHKLIPASVSLFP